MRARFAAIAAPFAVAAGCHAIAGIGDVTLGTADDAEVLAETAIETSVDTAPADSLTDVGPGAPCPSGRGPDMIRIATAAGSFCIDRTEVTEDQFALYLLKPDPPKTPARCATVSIAKPESWTNRGSGYARAYVNWCHAWSFCAWAGKRLCGAIGGGPIAPIASGEWTWACSQGASSTYPYGDTFVEGRCACSFADGGVAAFQSKVREKTECRGTAAPFNELYDMSGNLVEWVDGCDDADETPRCGVAGGSYFDRELAVACSSAETRDLDDNLPAIGIRCCAD